MAVDPRVLQAIGDPTGGRLGDIATTYINARQIGLENKRTKTEFDQKQAIVGAKVMGTYSQEAIDWYDNYKDEDGNPATPPDEAFRDYQLELMQRYDKSHQQFIPEQLQSIEVLKNGVKRSNELLRRFGEIEEKEEDSIFSKASVDKFTPESIKKAEESGLRSDLRLRPDTSIGSDGSSEQERHIKWLTNHKVPPDATDEEIESLGLPDMMESEAKIRAQRVQTRSGVDQTQHQKISRSDRLDKNKQAIGQATHDEWKKGQEYFTEMDRTIDAAKSALDSGDTQASQRIYKQLLTQVADSGVRAMGLFQEQDKALGHLAQRLMSNLQRFAAGTVPESEKEEFKNVLDYMKGALTIPKRQKLRDEYRKQLKDKGVDPFRYIPPDETPEVGIYEIRNSPLIDIDRKIELLQLYFPDVDYTKQ